MAEYADRALLRAKAGDGGHGCASVHREKFKPLGGPDGGNGGRGGDVILEVHPSMATLLDFHRRPVRRATNGKQGSGSNRNGAAGRTWSSGCRTAPWSRPSTARCWPT